MGPVLPGASERGFQKDNTQPGLAAHSGNRSPGEGTKAGGLLKCEASWGYSKTPTEENKVLLSSVSSGSVNKSRTGQPLQSEDQEDSWG